MDTKTKIIIISALLLFSIISIAFAVYLLFFRNEYSNVNIINVSTAPIESDQERSDDETENIQKNTDIHTIFAYLLAFVLPRFSWLVLAFWRATANAFFLS